MPFERAGTSESNSVYAYTNLAGQTTLPRGRLQRGNWVYVIHRLSGLLLAARSARVLPAKPVETKEDLSYGRGGRALELAIA